MTTQHIPPQPDLSGYQNVRYGHILKGDLLIWDDEFYTYANDTDERQEVIGTGECPSWHGATHGKSWGACRVYRKVPVPQQGLAPDGSVVPEPCATEQQAIDDINKTVHECRQRMNSYTQERRDELLRKGMGSIYADSDTGPSPLTPGSVEAALNAITSDEVRSLVESQAGITYPSKPSMHTFPTGAIRQAKPGKGRFDLIPYEPMLQLAIHFENGGKAHGDRNWEKGIPLSIYISAAKRHAAKAGCLWDENHSIAACWNFFCLLQTAQWIRDGKLPKELDDIGWLSMMP